MTATTHLSAPLSWTFTGSSQEPEKDQGGRVYLDFYNLKEVPFAITPDPGFLFLSETHQDVLEKLRYAIRSRMGFMLLTGEVGTGKTTLCRALLDQMQDDLQTVYVINPALSGHELLANILDDLEIAYSPQASKKELIDRLNRFLLANEAAEPVVIIVDDAQTMPLTTLEDLRLLSNLETDKTKLLQIVLAGQPELVELLDRTEIRQLKQRVAIHCRLDFLSGPEVGGYIDRRLFVAGNQGQVRFTPKVVRQIHKRSGGVPRIINKLSDLALTAAYTTNSLVVLPIHLRAACSELVEEQDRKRRFGVVWRRRLRAALIAAVAIATVMAAGYGTRILFKPLLSFGQVPQAAMNKPSAAENMLSPGNTMPGRVFKEGFPPSDWALDSPPKSAHPEKPAQPGRSSAAPGDSS
jgi:type II secretory pathway predicted ATPase ExeA